MNRTAALPPGTSPPLVLGSSWRLLVPIAAVVNFAAFRFLLQQNYSVETYLSAPGDFGTAEWCWIVLSICGVVLLV